MSESVSPSVCGFSAVVVLLQLASLARSRQLLVALQNRPRVFLLVVEGLASFPNNATCSFVSRDCPPRHQSMETRSIQSIELCQCCLSLKKPNSRKGAIQTAPENRARSQIFKYQLDTSLSWCALYSHGRRDEPYTTDTPPTIQSRNATGAADVNNAFAAHQQQQKRRGESEYGDIGRRAFLRQASKKD